ETMRLVEVVAVHPGAGSPPAPGTVDVRPLVNQVDGVGNSIPHGIVNGVPWIRLQGGDGGIITDPAVGDFGYVVCDGRDTSGVRSPGAAPTRGSLRFFALADGVYLGGLLKSGPPAQYLWFSADGIALWDRHNNLIATSSSGIDITPTGGPLTVHGDIIA